MNPTTETIISHIDGRDVLTVKFGSITLLEPQIMHVYQEKCAFLNMDKLNKHMKERFI